MYTESKTPFLIRLSTPCFVWRRVGRGWEDGGDLEEPKCMGLLNLLLADDRGLTVGMKVKVLMLRQEP